VTPRWPGNQAAAWRILGLGALAGAAGITALFVGRGPRPLRAAEDRSLFAPGPQGLRGTLTEAFGRGRLTLAYDTIEGSQDHVTLGGLQARLEEGTLWRVVAPRAVRAGENWTLEGPVALEAVGAGGEALGHGAVPAEGPALRWAAGAWEGLGPLEWTDQAGKGVWSVPAGWRRDASGTLTAGGPVRWRPLQAGDILGLEAARVESNAGFQDGLLEGVKASLAEGTVEARLCRLSAGWIQWPAPLAFRRRDGWSGTASGGRAPRPDQGLAPGLLELRDLVAARLGPEGEESLRARSARWTPAGLRLEGQATWEQPLQGIIAKLESPRIMMRDAEGDDLPSDLPRGEAWAEGQAVLTWGSRVLNSPRIRMARERRTWEVDAPVYGRSAEGTFTAGRGKGGARNWTFEGPVQASLLNGGTLRGQRLLWEGESWILSGQPAVWTRLRERLSGLKVVKTGEVLAFPEGLSGQLRASEGDLSLRADRGESRGDRILLRGRVECDGLGWQVAADALTFELAPGRVLRRILATGSVTLRGRMGEGRGEALEVDQATQQARWQGRVRGLSQDGGK